MQKFLILRRDSEDLNRISMEGDSSFDTCQEMNRDMKWCEEQDSSCLKRVEVMLDQTYTIVNVCGHQARFSTQGAMVSFERVGLIQSLFSYSSNKMRSSKNPQ